jgi:hypothetical protein
LTEAWKYYKRASDHGDYAGSNCLGLCLEFGKGIAIDLNRSAEFYRIGADGGHAPAQRNYGFFLEHGLGVPIDLSEALRYYKLSADQKYCEGAMHCALCYHYGIGVDADFETASLYYERAASNSPIVRNRNSFRCLRSLHLADFSQNQFSELRSAQSLVFDECLATRPLLRSQWSSDYMQDIPHSGRSLIGHGGSSSVYLIDNSHGPEKLAVKEFDPARLDKSVFIREIEVLVKLNHPCIVRIFGYLMPSESRRGAIHMEYAANRSLKHVLGLARTHCKPVFWTSTGIAMIICGIVLGMRFIHSRGFIHQDLKPDNILLNDRGHALITDFGTTRPTDFDYTPTGDAGTVHYAAPERFKEDIEIRTPAIDVFSFGLVLYEIIVGGAVFPAMLVPFEVIRMHNDGFRPDIPDHVYPHMRDLIIRCWSPNPTDRPSFDEILSFIESNRFEIFREVDPKAVHAYVNGVKDWERNSKEASNL